ncbi:Programmed cell death protein 2 C-terminal domain-containing protein [Entamoeba marina]
MSVFVCSVGYHTNKTVLKDDETNPELSCIGGNVNEIKMEKCSVCGKEMEVLLQLHCPTNEIQNRRMYIFYCKADGHYQGITVSHEEVTHNKDSNESQQDKKDQNVDVGFSFMDDVDDSLLTQLVSKPEPKQKPKPKSKPKQKEKGNGKWVEWYDEYKEHNKETDPSDLELLKEYHDDEFSGEDVFEEGNDDPQWTKFIKSMNKNPSQIIRQGGNPLLISSQNIGKDECNEKCSKCGEPLSYELQILPSLVSVMRTIPDFSTLLVFSCDKCYGETIAKVVKLDPVD